MFIIGDEQAYKEYKEYLASKPEVVSIKGTIVETKDYVVDTLNHEDLVTIAEGLVSDFATEAENFEDSPFSIEGMKTEVIENQGYKFRIFV